MTRTLPAELPDGHLLRLEHLRAAMAKADLKNRETWRQQVGGAVLRCFALAKVTQKEAAALLGRDAAQIGRWISGAERAQVDAILAVERLRQPFVQAVAELAGVDVRTVITIRSSAQ